MIPADIRELAEEPDRFGYLSPAVERHADERACVLQGPTWGNVAGVRVEADEVAELVADVRRRIPPAKHVNWWIGPSSRPHDLFERLLALGIQPPADRADTLHALACVREPASGPPEVEVRTVDDFETFLTWTEVMWDAFETAEERRDRERPHLEAIWESERASGVPRSFLALLDGRAAGTGRSIYTDRGSFMVAGATAPWARGRGVYRALVSARWADAVARGAPALVTTAMPDTSLPILLRLGFEEICVMRRLEDVR
jgi:hypothetical protein